jgi:hypothetical protein
MNSELKLKFNPAQNYLDSGSLAKLGIAIVTARDRHDAKVTQADGP